MPTPERLAEVDQLRERAVDAALDAERIEAEARKARRRATSRMKAYESAVQELQKEATCAS